MIIFFFSKVNTIAVAKPEKAKMVENMLMQMARSGQIQGKVRSFFTSLYTFFCWTVTV